MVVMLTPVVLMVVEILGNSLLALIFFQVGLENFQPTVGWLISWIQGFVLYKVLAPSKHWLGRGDFEKPSTGRFFPYFMPFSIMTNSCFFFFSGSTKKRQIGVCDDILEVVVTTICP